MIALVTGSLFRQVAYLLVDRLAWCLRGGMDASISRACVGVVLKAAQIRHSADLCTLSRGRARHLVLFHQAGHA